MKIKNNIIFSVIFTSIWVLWIFYNRFLRERLPKNIISQNTFNIHMLLVFAAFFGSLCLTIYFLLMYLKIIPRPKSKIKALLDNINNYLETKPFYNSSLKFFKEYIIKGPEKVYENVIYPNIYLRPLIRHTGAKLSYYFQEKPYLLYVIGFALPKIIPWIIFSTELFFFHSIFFFYKSLILFLIPLLLSIIIYMIKHHCIVGINIHKIYYDFSYTDETIHVYLRHLPDLSEQERKTQENNADWAGDDWFFLQNLYSICYKLEDKKELYMLQLNIIRYSLMTLTFFIYSLLLL